MVAWAVFSFQIGKTRFDLGIAPFQTVVLRIADFRGVVRVVRLVCLGKQARKALQFGTRLINCQLFD